MEYDSFLLLFEFFVTLWFPTSKPALKASEDLRHLRLEHGLPLGRENAVAVFLGVADVGELLGRGTIVDVAVGIAGDERRLVGRLLLDVQADLHGQLAGERDEDEVA